MVEGIWELHSGSRSEAVAKLDLQHEAESDSSKPHSPQTIYLVMVWSSNYQCSWEERASPNPSTNSSVCVYPYVCLHVQIYSRFNTRL